MTPFEIDCLKHIAFICDGHRRWAQENNKDFYHSYHKGVDKIEELAGHVFGNTDNKIEHLTFYILSAENLSRTKGWIAIYQKVLAERLESCLEMAHKNKVRIKFLGDKNLFDIKTSLIDIEQRSKDFTKGQINFALNYGGRQEILSAVDSIVSEKTEGEITKEVFENHLYTKDFPDPDLLIRTSGEYRLSNFMIWQCAYTELYFIDNHFPELSIDDMEKAIAAYHLRKRRRGL